MTEQDGGPAYPQHGWSSNPETIKRMQGREGISARDYFAAKVLQAAMTGATGLGIMSEQERNETWSKLAALCYECSDAMLRERERRPQ